MDQPSGYRYSRFQIMIRFYYLCKYLLLVRKVKWSLKQTSKYDFNGKSIYMMDVTGKCLAILRRDHSCPAEKLQLFSWWCSIIGDMKQVAADMKNLFMLHSEFLAVEPRLPKWRDHGPKEVASHSSMIWFITGKMGHFKSWAFKNTVLFLNVGDAYGKMFYCSLFRVPGNTKAAFTELLHQFNNSCKKAFIYTWLPVVRGWNEVFFSTKRSVYIKLKIKK